MHERGSRAFWIVGVVLSALALTPMVAFGWTGIGQLMSGTDGTAKRDLATDAAGHLIVGFLAGSAADVNVAKVGGVVVASPLPVNANQSTSPWVTSDNHTTALAPISCQASDGAAFYIGAKTGQLPAALVGGRLDVTVGGTNSVTQSTSPWVTSDNHTTAAAPLSCQASDGAAFYVGAKTGQLPAALVGGRLDVNVGAALPAGTNLLGKVGIDQTTPGTTNAVVSVPTTAAAAGLTPKVFTANTALNIKASAGNVYGVAAINAAAAVCWLQFYNTAGTPTCGTSVVWALPMPVTPGTLNYPAGALALANFTTGIAICVSTTNTGGVTCGSTASGTVFVQ